MRTFYYIMLRVAYVMADLAEYIAQPLINALWDAAGALEYWANEKLNIIEGRDQ